MYLYSLRTKSVKDLLLICRDNHILNYKKKNKEQLINHIILHTCFHSISNYEDDDYDILKLYFMKFKYFIENNNGNDVENDVGDDVENDVENLYLVPRPPNSHIFEFIDGLKDKYCKNNLAEINFELYENDRYNHLYKYHKECIMNQYGDLGENNQQLLIHGTDESKINSILESDFSLTINVHHGSVLGKGIYFTNDLEFASKYSERGKKEKYYLLCSVHVGNIIRGNRRMDMLPKIEEQDRYYDTAVDCIHNPKQFVKFKNNTYNFLGIIRVKILDDKSSLFKYGSIKPKPNLSHKIRSSKIMKANTNELRKISLINHTKMPVHTYLINDKIKSGELMILSEELKVFLKLQKGELISKRDCWERIKTYCCNNHLFYRNYGTGIYLPDKKLIELLELSPTTRISSDNIQKLLKPHYNNINKENMSYLIEYSHRMNIIESNQERCLNTYKDKNFICGFFSTKKKYPNDFILLQEFRAGESDPYPQKYILKT